MLSVITLLSTPTIHISVAATHTDKVGGGMHLVGLQSNNKHKEDEEYAALHILNNSLKLSPQVICAAAYCSLWLHFVVKLAAVIMMMETK